MRDCGPVGVCEVKHDAWVCMYVTVGGMLFRAYTISYLLKTIRLCSVTSDRWYSGDGYSCSAVVTLGAHAQRGLW